MNKTRVKRILFITLNNLGDIILTTPVLEKLHQEIPDAKIDVITGRPGYGIFSHHPAVGKVIIRGSGRNFLDRVTEVIGLYKKKYDLVVDLKNSLIPWIIGAKYHSGTHFFNKRPEHKKDEHLAKLTGLGMDVSGESKFYLPVNDKDRDDVDRVMGPNKDRLMVVVNPGAKSHLKRWSAEKFAKLSDRLILELGCKVFVTGNDDDKDVIEKFRAYIKKDVTDMRGKTSLGALTELIKRSDIVVTNDSAPLHIASAVGTKTVAIFGPSNEKQYGPVCNKNVVVTPKMPCRPCSEALCSTGPDEGCISNIEVDEVFRAVRKLLG
ncbi:MAG: glycosyltransferase family 9 protein [Candidatus Omnitrophota bacterium]